MGRNLSQKKNEAIIHICVTNTNISANITNIYNIHNTYT